jgi:enamine deaminase RidA (YjgF/YER057c/UK114 family)
MAEKQPINPEQLAPPVGFAHGWLVSTGELKTLYLAGQCAYDGEGRVLHKGDLVAQLDRSMANLAEVLKEAGMEFADVVQLNLFVLSRDDYTTAREEFGKVWKRHCHKHYPAMALFMVSGLYEPDALIEIQGIAAR